MRTPGPVDIRCGICDKLLGRRTEDGSVEIKIRKVIIAQVASGRVFCPRCQQSIQV